MFEGKQREGKEGSRFEAHRAIGAGPVELESFLLSLISSSLKRQERKAKTRDAVSLVSSREKWVSKLDANRRRSRGASPVPSLPFSQYQVSRSLTSPPLHCEPAIYILLFFLP